MLLSLIISLLFLSKPITSQDPFIPDRNDLNDLREQLQFVIENDPENTDPNHESFSELPLIGSLVRLAFHDCIGPQEGARPDPDRDDLIQRQCDGCLDFGNPAHAGLETLAFNKINSLYRNNWEPLGMSRADFYATVGTMALEYAAAQGGSDSSDDRFPPGSSNVAQFFFGRRDCSTAPDARANAEADFPAAEKAWDAFFEFFQDNLGLNLRDSTVIMGAHALGRCHRDASGFEGRWTESPHVFDNQFWKNVIDPSHEWTQIPAPGNEFFQWVPLSNDPDIVMLNPDMSVQGLLEPHMDSNGKVDCRLQGSSEIGSNGIVLCGDEVSAQRGFVDNYANDNRLFLADFLRAWNKLLSVGWDAAELVEVIADPHEYQEFIPADITIPSPVTDPTKSPTTTSPTTASPTTDTPTTDRPTTSPIDDIITNPPPTPTTATPTTETPTTASPTDAPPTTAEPTTAEPTTQAPTEGEGGEVPVENGERCCRSIKEPAKKNFNGRCWHHETIDGCETEFNKGQLICDWEVDNCLTTEFELNCKARDDSCTNHFDCCSDFCRLNTQTCR